MNIFIKGQLSTLNKFIDAMVGDSDALLLHEEKAADEIVPYLDLIDEECRVITYNNIGSGFPLWKKLGVKLYNIIVDHPAFYIESIINDYYSNLKIVCIDRGHKSFLEEALPVLKENVYFLPHGGVISENEESVRDIDVFYAGSFHLPENIVFAPIPFGNSEDFYGFIIDYYERHDFVEAQDAVKEYLKSKMHTEMDSSCDNYLSELLILTQYVVKTVDPYYTSFRRLELIESLAKNGIHVTIAGGECWKELAESFPEEINYLGMKTPEECLEIIGRSKILINDLPQFADGAHERIFNGMFRKTVILTNPSHYLCDRFTDGEDIAFWDGKDTDKAVEIVRSLLENDDLRKKMADNAYNKIAKDSWKDRFEDLITGYE